MKLPPNQSPESTAVGAVRSAVADHVASRRWLSFFSLGVVCDYEEAHYYDRMSSFGSDPVAWSWSVAAATSDSALRAMSTITFAVWAAWRLRSKHAGLIPMRHIVMRPVSPMRRLAAGHGCSSFTRTLNRHFTHLFMCRWILGRLRHGFIGLTN